MGMNSGDEVPWELRNEAPTEEKEQQGRQKNTAQAVVTVIALVLVAALLGSSLVGLMI